MRLYLKFNSIFLTATLVSAMTIGAFNAVVDPYSTVRVSAALYSEEKGYENPIG